MKAFFAEFKKFISRGNVVDMAVGVAVATAFTKIVTAFTNGFITPLLALLTNNADLSDMKWIIKEAVTDAEGVVTQKEVAFMWGSFVQAIIDFLIIALVLFTVMKIFNRTMERARELQNELMTSPEAKKKAEEEARAAEEKAAADKAAAEEAAAAAAAEKQAELDAYAAQVECTEHTARLLEEIRDLLKTQKQ